MSETMHELAKLKIEKISNGWLIKAVSDRGYYTRLSVATNYELSTWLANALSKGFRA